MFAYTLLLVTLLCNERNNLFLYLTHCRRNYTFPDKVIFRNGFSLRNLQTKGKLASNFEISRNEVRC